MSIVLPDTWRVRDALIHLEKTQRVNWEEVKGDDKYYIVRFYAWGKKHSGLQITMVGDTTVQWMREGIIIELLDNGINIYQESRQGTLGEIRLTNNMARQSYIEQAITMALEGIK